MINFNYLNTLLYKMIKKIKLFFKWIKLYQLKLELMNLI